MPDSTGRILRRLRNHPASGVNWRLTRLVQDFASLRICNLCHVIQTRMLVLPCAHFLCDLCQMASSPNGRGMCPLDREPFHRDDCQSIELPAMKGNSFKAYCWNEVNGCDFVGTMESILMHYETDCTFHRVECPRCGDSVLHKDLPRHHMAGCSGNSEYCSKAGPSQQSSSSDVRSLKTSLEEIKSLLAVPCHDDLIVLQSQMNELVEQSRNQKEQLLAMSRQQKEHQREHREAMEEVAVGITSTLSRDFNSLRTILERHVAQKGDLEARGSSGKFIPWSVEKKLILRKLEVIANESMRYIENLNRHALSQQACVPSVTCELQLPCLGQASDVSLSTTPEWSNHRWDVKFEITIRNVECFFNRSSNNHCDQIAVINRWLCRDVCVMLLLRTVKQDQIENLEVCVKTFGILDTSRRFPTELSIKAMHGSLAQSITMNKARHGLGPFDAIFWESLSALKFAGLLKKGVWKFQLSMTHKVGGQCRR